MPRLCLHIIRLKEQYCENGEVKLPGFDGYTFHNPVALSQNEHEILRVEQPSV